MRSIIFTTFYVIISHQNLCGKLLLILIWTHYLNYFFTHQYQLITICHLKFIMKILWKYCRNVTQFWFLIPYIIFLSFFSFFSSIRFFSFLFSCFFSSTYVHLPPISIFTLCLTFCFSSYLQNIFPLLPLFFVLFLLHTHTHTHTLISLP